MLKIYNTLSRQKEEFTPMVAGKVSMYVCGITVYDLCHIGHARFMLVFDTTVRYLRHRGYEVNYIRNITDIDDKIINRANENGEDIDTLTARYIEAMNEDTDALNMLRPDHEPRATEHIKEIIDITSQLIEKDYAYAADNGDVYFAVSKYKDYGQLSGKKIDELRAGERVAVDEGKKDPLDFVLWKSSKPNEPSWDSPWGAGRPGWHIECSAMSIKTLGEEFDIHGGGQDLQFPHHENEIAQSCCATGKGFARLWMHNGFVRVDDEKMSKSLGNFFTIREVMEKYSPEVIRFFILSSHYRSQLNYSDSHLDEARASLEGLYIALRDTEAGEGDIDESYLEQFNNVMDDDFNTAKAIAIFHELAREINRISDKPSSEAARLARTLKQLAAILGMLQSDPTTYLQGGSNGDGLSNDDIENLINDRTEARKNKDFAESDRIRDLLLEQGIALEDGPVGTIWRRN
ncbi:MAG: cysteine--tRNA ligase [Gammaproteobacteria bacterium]|nr:cysteine--tRNA ligase [Gammaproteobacteria bacterium]